MTPAWTPLQRAGAVGGGALIAGTWLFLVLTRPGDWESVGGSWQAVVTLLGYLGGAVLLLCATVPRLPVRTVSVIPVAIALNIVVGQIVGTMTPLPLYLDSLGTALVAALGGPVAGLATGALSSVVWGVFNPSVLPFAAGSAVTGLLIGWAVRRGVLRNIVLTAVVGALIGVVTAMIAAPVAAFVYGGTSGLGTGAVVSLFREMGNSLLGSVTLQSILSDPLDKALVMLAVWGTIKALPKRTLRAFRAPDAVPAARGRGVGAVDGGAGA
ncbi:ECF transporter S component [Corynebacterium frankenforstense]|uniref:ECF transporter S component n=1 Tax=Corynebacterium frankenforstense TaxID=1230998 RepID=UPI00254FFCE0|nr:ECF transporter S component [Corynebacterium frankenforstense]MDK6258991.1 ECF transporter S component [Corynebacterium frankenforstense]